jgi:uncharacterized protein (TIGR02145 family)
MKKPIFFALFCMAAFAQDIFTDSRDGKKYKTVKIDSQIWMAQNLDYHGKDGYLGLCYGDKPEEKRRKPENCKKYGRLYDWDEAMKACPDGWHLPSNEEWQALVDFAGGEDVAGPKLKAKSGWDTGGYKNSNGTDNYGFSALPGGFGISDCSFYDVNYYGFWWGATNGNNVYGHKMSYHDNAVSLYYYNKSDLFSVRCIQD